MIASVLHRAAGLTIAADRPLPGFVLQPGVSNRADDLHIHLQSQPAWHAASAGVLHIASTNDETGRPTVTVSRSADGFHFAYADGTRAWIDTPGANVWCTWRPSATLEDTCTYLSGPILGLVLRLRGSLAFHASAVQLGTHAFGFAGPHGAGKSTLAAALGAAGYAVITDDVLHVRREADTWIAEPFPAMLKLWPEGARLAFGEATDLPRIAAGWNKRALALGDHFAAVTAPAPLGAVACFAEPASRAAIEPLTPASALLRLAANSSAAHLLDGTLRAAEFRTLSAFVRNIPCVLLTPPEDADGYAPFVQQVIDWGCDVNGRAGT